jgi:hypothetical protein
MRISLLHLIISFALLCFSKTSSAASPDEAIQYYTDNDYFPDKALLEGVKEALVRPYVNLEGMRNEWDNWAKDQYGYSSPEDYFLHAIYYLSLEGVSSLEGINRLPNLGYLEIERSTVTDFSPLSESWNLHTLEYDDNELISLSPSIFDIPNLSSLMLDENNFTSIPVIPSSTKIRYLDLDLNFLDLSDKTILEDIQNLKDLNISVDYESQFPKVLLNISERIATSPNSSSAKENFLHGLELMVSIFEEDSFKQMILDSGLVLDSFQNFTLADLHASNIEKYEDENESLSTDADLNSMESFIANDFINRIDTCIGFLKTASDANQAFSIDPDYLGSDESVLVDRGDILMCLAIAEAAQGFFQFTTAYHWDQNLQEAEDMDELDQISMETMLKDRKLLTLRSSSQMSDARNSFVSAIEYYDAGIEIIKKRLSEPSLFSLDPGDLEDEAEFSADLTEFKSAVYQTTYSIEDNDEFQGNFAVINPDAFFTGQFDPINQLPQSDAGYLSVIGDTFTSHEVDDPTFGGVFPNWTQDYLKNKMIDWEMLDDNASPLSSVKSVPSSNSSAWSHSGWFGYFLKESNPVNEEKFWAYHQHFGWVYIASLNTSSVWLYNPIQKAWIWTAPILFPYLYNYSSNQWQFLLDDKILTWDEASRSWN